MIVDIEKAKEEFLKYTSNYDLSEESIIRKQKHSLRVMEISKEIATKMYLSQEEIEIATLIGLLHDIGRFEQYKRYKNYMVISEFDHGDYAVEILNKDIRKYIVDSKYDNIIKKAIKNHNKYEIEKGLSEKEEFFAKLIRDADKIDILYECVEIFWKGKEHIVEKSTISDEIYNQFKENKIIKIEKDRNYNSIDDMLITLAYIFDINFKQSYEIIRENDYINRIIKRFNFEDLKTKEKVKELIAELNNYINNKCEL